MSRELSAFSRRAFCLLLPCGLLALAAPGCGEGSNSQTGGGGASPVPPSVQESNKNMEDFMKSQQAQKKE